ncbi:mannose-6-phosphate isomerase [Bacteroidia bacterium]|nr:mannose-6-phosphate isomerase [Bacteroidia bacterium]
MLYPLKFTPSFRSKIWGGQKIKQIFPKVKLENIGEAWLLSGVEDNETAVSEGNLAANSINDLVEIFMSDLLGDDNYIQFGENFPLLFKFIDANDDLSIQVHPDAHFAEHHGFAEKNEAWYVLDADENAELLLGFNRKTSKKQLLEAIQKGRLSDLLNHVKVAKGDLLFVPAGSIHAIGKGVMLAEIQQSSDTTFRIWDYDRIDTDGLSRKLHIEEALHCLDYEKTVPLIDKFPLETPYFTIDNIKISSPHNLNLTDLDSFICLLCVDGAAEIHTDLGDTGIKKGELVLLPAITNTLQINPKKEVEILTVNL